MNSVIPNSNANKKNKLKIFLFLKKQKKYVANPQKHAKNDGINRKDIGIKILKSASNVRDILIQ